MIESAIKYKEISLKIIDVLSNEDTATLEEFLIKRQDILDNEKEVEKFKQQLIDVGILEIDKKIHNLLSSNLSNIKNQIKEHRLLMKANNSYININKEKLNIFNKKV